MRFRTMIKDACRRILRVGFAGRKVNGIEGWEKITAKSAGSSFRMLKPYLKNSEVFIDIGANTGAFTQKVIERKPDIQVHLFEPVPAYYQKCKEKFGDNEKIMMNMLKKTPLKGLT